MIAATITITLILLKMMNLLILRIGSTYSLFPVTHSLLQNDAVSLSSVLAWSYSRRDSLRALPNTVT